MDSVPHIIKLILNPRFLSKMASYDVSSTMIELATSSNAFSTQVQ